MAGRTRLSARALAALVTAVSACGQPAPGPAPIATATASSATSPLPRCLLRARELGVSHADALVASIRHATSALCQVEDVSATYDEWQSSALWGGFLFDPPPALLQRAPTLATRWRVGVDRCRHSVTDPTTENEQTLACSQPLAWELFQADLAAYRADVLLDVDIGARASDDPAANLPPTFYAVVRYRRLFEPCVYELRAGNEYRLTVPGSDGPAPSSPDDARAIAGQLAVKLLRGADADVGDVGAFPRTTVPKCPLGHDDHRAAAPAIAR